MYSRYSSSVVAPMQCSSPRASIGLSRLPASMAPSVLPAPTMVCSSSIKRMILPSLFLTSFSTPLSAPRTRRGTWRPRPAHPCPGEHGAVLQIFRHIALDDALGQALSNGGFADTGLHRSVPGCSCVLRLRMRMTLRISVSRPITGSSLLALAISTRSWPYFFSAL